MPTIPSYTEKTTPVDADLTIISDSSAGNAIKKLSWANIKATLKAYFDTLYPAKTAISGTISELAYFNGNNSVASLPVATYPSALEMTYVKGVTSSVQTQLTAKLDKSVYDANSILYATTDNTPVALTVAASTLVGRKATGNISAMSAAEARAVLNVEDGATANSKASGAELDAATDDAKIATAKALKDSHNVPSVAPGTSGNVLTSNGTDWTSAAPAGSVTYKNGADSHSMSVTGTQTIAHGFGKTPNKIRITSMLFNNNASGSQSTGVFNGTTISCIYGYFEGSSAAWATSSTYVIRIHDLNVGTNAYETATISADATNITLTWSKTGSPTATLGLIWEVE